MTAPSWLDDARRVSLAQVAGDLGVRVDRRGICVCPACGREDSTRIFAGATRWKCHGCNVSGDAVDLVCVVLTGSVYQSAHRDVVRAWYAERGYCAAFGDSVPTGYRVAPRPPAPVVERAVAYPPRDEVEALLRQCVPCADDDAVVDWMVQRRGLGPDAPRRLALTGVLALHRRAACPEWARLGERSWAALGYRVVVPMYDAAGVLASVRARCAGDPPWPSAPKAAPPRGFEQRGLVMANRLGLKMLRGEAAPLEVVVVEGEPQWMAACLRWPSRAVLGIVAGSWTDEVAARVPRGAAVVIATDHDAAGDRYAAKIEETMVGRRVVRHEGVMA